MNPTFFKTQNEFRKWLTKNHEKETELLVGFYKIGSGKLSMTWPESVDQALCFGWIDGVRKSLDKESYTIRFSPRRSNSIWSAINMKKMDELIKKGLMLPAGLAIYAKRTEKKSAIYAFENEAVNLRDDLEKKFRSNAKAWEFFQRQGAYYKKRCNYWVMTAKQEKTMVSRLEKLINSSAAGLKV